MWHHNILNIHNTEYVCIKARLQIGHNMAKEPNNLIFYRECFAFWKPMTKSQVYPQHRDKVYLSPLHKLTKLTQQDAADWGQTEWFVYNSVISEGAISPPCCSELEVEWDYPFSRHVIWMTLGQTRMADLSSQASIIGGHGYESMIHSMNLYFRVPNGLKFQYSSYLEIQQICDRLIHFAWQRFYSHHHYFLSFFPRGQLDQNV